MEWHWKAEENRRRHRMLVMPIALYEPPRSPVVSALALLYEAYIGKEATGWASYSILR